MIEIIILNNSLYPIKIWMFYTEYSELLPTVKVSNFFPNGDSKVLIIPDNTHSASMTIDILDEKGISIPVSSLKFDNNTISKKNAPRKIFQFVGYKNLSDIKDYFFNILELPLNTNFTIKSFINLENKSYTSVKCDVTFQINSKEFKYESPIIKAKKNIKFKLPFNCNYIQFRVFKLNILKNLELVKLFEFTNLPVKKCYTLSSNLFNTSFSLKENSCD